MAYNPEADEPILNIKLDDEEVYLHRWNTSHFTFLGDLALYDHVFIITEETDESQSGYYLFSTADEYEEITDFIKDQELPQHLNLTEVTEMDLQAWYYHYLGDTLLDKSFPEEWTHE